MNASDFILYASCDCNVWPLSPLSGVGRCGRCGVKPDGPMYPTREEATEEFQLRHGKLPWHDQQKETKETHDD